jgi:hypothetical protein
MLRRHTPTIVTKTSPWGDFFVAHNQFLSERDYKYIWYHFSALHQGCKTIFLKKMMQFKSYESQVSIISQDPLYTLIEIHFYHSGLAADLSLKF